MGHSNIWNAHPKNYGPGSRACRVCGNPHAIIRKYGLMCCRQCFRSNAKEIGFIKSVEFSLASNFNSLEERWIKATVKQLKLCYGFMAEAVPEILYTKLLMKF
uniref:40S ribosomal protein S29 n=2 Tax=Chenopodium quinoa TaxID=63459 RepID=A0A803MYN3_CHEQI